MKKYFYTDGKDKHGPFSLEELEKENISGDTLVWFEGLEDWTAASQIREVVAILELKPPPIGDGGSGVAASIPEEPSAKLVSKQRLFSRAFSFDGRIRRIEYGLSWIIMWVVHTIYLLIQASAVSLALFWVYFIVFCWFLFAQSVKRAHDIGWNGWIQIYPVLIFIRGNKGTNKYGPDPRGE
ncbi:MAG: GYF domain-containing protein [Pseudohongiellaceae bacterium]